MDSAGLDDRCGNVVALRASVVVERHHVRQIHTVARILAYVTDEAP